MKILQVTRKGVAPVLHLLADAAAPVLDAASNNLLLRVLTCSLGPGDIKVMTGALSHPHVPYTPGFEVCGVVEAVGNKAATQYCVGDRVVAVLRARAGIAGGMAEYVVADAALCAVVPPSISSLDAATLPLAGVAAMNVIKTTVMTSDSKVLVLNASSSVGAMVVELAKRVAGVAFVAGTTPSEKLVTALPLDQVLLDDGEHAKWHDELQGKGFDVVVDCGGKETGWRLGEKVLTRSRSSCYFVVLGDLWSDGAVKSTHELFQLGFENIAKKLWRGPQIQFDVEFPSTVTMEEVLSLVEQRKLTPSPVTPLPLTAEALQAAVARAQDPHAPVSDTVVFQVSE